jgi:hypothetical protein
MGNYMLIDGRIILAESLEEWAEWFQDIDARRVALTQINGYEVSTVFLGIDHGWDRSDPNHLPVLFETMIFVPESDRICLDYQARYCELEEARAGHKMVVTLIREGRIAELD